MKTLHNSIITFAGSHEFVNRRSKAPRMKCFRPFVFSLAVAVFFGTTVLSSAQNDRMMGGVGITVFVDRNFRGAAQTFQQDVPDLRSFGLDNRISSLRIGRGEQWEVCDGPGYTGRCTNFSGEESDLAHTNWNDRIRSIRRTGIATNPAPPGPVYIVLFDQVNFRGTPRNFNGPEASLDRRAQSVTIGGGTWQFCDGRNFGGRCITLNSSVSDLSRYNMRSRIASARPLSPPTAADFYVILFDRENYRGNPTNFHQAHTSISKNARSATIGNGSWELCDGRNFTGRCVTISQNVPNLRIFNVGQRIASLRPLVAQPR
ncbi:MAG TPA: beta/gamma crystallin-related protein [Pyrinomonadaceae bacterium]|nr:beta/gamma crystallin-related protein [Pyrinomonadaceae bacterium]